MRHPVSMIWYFARKYVPEIYLNDVDEWVFRVISLSETIHFRYSKILIYQNDYTEDIKSQTDKLSKNVLTGHKI